MTSPLFFPVYLDKFIENIPRIMNLPQRLRSQKRNLTGFGGFRFNVWIQLAGVIFQNQHRIDTLGGFLNFLYSDGVELVISDDPEL